MRIFIMSVRPPARKLYIRDNGTTLPCGRNGLIRPRTPHGIDGISRDLQEASALPLHDVDPSSPASACLSFAANSSRLAQFDEGGKRAWSQKAALFSTRNKDETNTADSLVTLWQPGLGRTEAQESTTRSAKRQQRELSVAPAVMGGRASLFS